jgi:CubicO group peptidase (beta-lactamase class C family)
MRRTVLILTLAVALCLSAAQAPARGQDLGFTFFGDYLESLRRQAGIPGLSAVIVGPYEVLWTRAYGHQDVERAVPARTDTPFHVDGLTQLLTSTLVLRCVEEGRLSLADRAGQFVPGGPDADATLEQLLTHTAGAPGSATFEYRPERLRPLERAIAVCNDASFRAMIADLLERISMADSVPGVDVIARVDPEIQENDMPRYSAVLERLATPYSVDRSGRSSPSAHPFSTLHAGAGVVSTADDLAKFDLAIKRGVLLKAETLAAAWRPPVGAGRQPLPHGLGWFVQGYNGARVVWQYGLSDSASSSLVVTIVPRGLTLILTANSDGLAKPFALSAGDVTASPFGKVFLGTFVR